MSKPSIDISSAVGIQPEANFRADTVTFTPDDEHLVGGGRNRVCAWRVQDGKQVATMTLTNKVVMSLAISNDGKYIAAGTDTGDVLIWDAKTYKQVFADDEEFSITRAVDFSPDSSRLVASLDCYTIVWDVAARKRAWTIDCHDFVVAAKYSPEGDRIATATAESVVVWDSSNGGLLVNITVSVVPEYNTGLLWFNNCLLVVSNKTIKEFNASTGSAVSEWPALHSDTSSSIVLAGRRKIIAYSSSNIITFWDSLTHAKLFRTKLHCNIYSIVFSLDHQYLAIATNKGINIGHLSGTIDLFSPAVSHTILQDSGFRIGYAALDSWKGNRLAHAEKSLTTAIMESRGTIHHVLASRAFVRIRLGQVDSAILDAEKSIEIQLSLIGYIAKFVALVAKGKMLEAFRACDIAFQLCHATHTTELLLVKAVVLFIAGEHEDAIERINDLIKATGVDSPFCLVKTYMYIFLGNQHMSNGNYDHAIELLQRAEAQLDDNAQQPPLVVLLVSGWEFDSLGITLRQRLCEAFYAAGRTKEAIEAPFKTVDTLREKTESVVTWISDFRSKCIQQLHKHGDIAMEGHQYDKAISEYSAALLLDPSGPQGLFVKRSRAYAACSSWESALNDANKVIKLDSSSFLGYERKYAALHGAGRHNDAIDAYETMLFTISQSSDPTIRDRSSRYITPAETKTAIRAAVRRAIDHSPPELINTQSGHLLNKTSRALSFESQPIFAELISSTTTEIDHARIEREVTEYYKYATFSHKWTPFMNLNIFNHKESPEIITEMEKATGVSADVLMVLRPGSGGIREQLRLASTRDTTRVEDAAYSLLGIFDMSLPVTYSEGDQALGRLLAQLLTSSGDTGILAWTGQSGSFNSCLPTSITVFKELPTTHVPTASLALTGTTTTVNPVVSGLYTTSLIDMTLAIRLHDRLNGLPVSSFSGQRMRLPCLAFRLGRVAGSRRGSERVFYARTTALGIVELRTTEDLSLFGPLYLAHPWIDFLLDRRPTGTEMLSEHVISEASKSISPGRNTMPSFDENDELFPPPSSVSSAEQEARVLDFVSRLRLPFGALLLTQTRQNVEEYRRIAPESLITVQVEEMTPETMKVLIHSARVLDVL